MNLVLPFQLLFIAIICVGEDVYDSSGSGIGEETTTNPPPPDWEDFVRELLLAAFCSSKPDVCAQSPSFCPCGPVQETILAPFTFEILPILPCPTVNANTATFRKCDVFIQYAAIEASLRLQSGIKELEYLYYQCFVINVDSTVPDSIAQIMHFMQEYYLVDQQNELLGVVGPNDPDTLEIFPYIIGEVYRKLTISYSTSQDVVDNRDKYPYFYSTVPPPAFFTKVTFKLLSDFGWRRVAIVSSMNRFHLRNSELLSKLATGNDSLQFLLTNAYDEDPVPILERFKQDDFRIYVANVESSKARNLFCHALRMKLTTDRHQWILPSFYDYNWWRGPDHCDKGDTNCCTNDEILDASLGTIFIGESTIDDSSSETVETVEKVYNLSLRFINTTKVQITPEDRLFLLHSKLLYVYDVVILYAAAFNAAIGDLTAERGNVTEDENDEFCKTLVTPLKPNTTNILTEKMNEILNNSAFCGYSGYYILGNSSTLGQAWITQLQYYEDCVAGVDLGSFKTNVSRGCYKESDIGRYTNFNKPNNCTYFKLEPANSIDLGAFNEFQFKNSCCHQRNDMISSRPYMWKGEDPWKPPTDGACYGESCHCLNQLGLAEIVVGFVITFSGIFLCCILILLNCLMRKNKHIKASSPRFNFILIVNCMVMYMVPIFTSLSLSGTYFNINQELLIPCSCEIIKWISNIGLTLILSTMVCRNWRIYRIFFNPRIEERRFLSDFWIILLMILLVIPVLLVVISWTAFNGFEYELHVEKFSCPGLDVDDSIETFKVTHRCTANHITLWEGVILAYDFVLGTLLIFLAYQNSTISSHFSEEGEFASRAMFFVTLFLIPTFALNLIINDSDNSLNIQLYFWSKVGYGTIFPTLLLIGLYLPKFIEIVKDKQSSIRERKTIKVQYSLQQEYESKVNEIGALRSRLKTLKQDSSTELTTTTYDNHQDSFSMPYNHRHSSLAFTRSFDHRDSPFGYNGGLDHRNSAITSTVFSFHDLKKSPTPSPIALHSKQFFPQN